MNNTKIIINLLTKLNLVFRDITLDEQTIKVYLSAFDDTEINKLKSACKCYLKTGKKFPLPSEILELC